MTKKKKIQQKYQDLNFNDFRWCIENDFQVYVKPLSSDGKGFYKIAVRRGGISSKGLDYYKEECTKKVYKSKETLSEKIFKNKNEAFSHLNYVYGHLKKKYG